MKPRATTIPEGNQDLQLEGACFVCDGDLALRVSVMGVARTWCGRCRFISRPAMAREGDTVQLVHPLAAA